MKNHKTKKLMLASLTLVLIFTACYEFDFVNQPYTADPNSFFDVQVNVSYINNNVDQGISYFGILLPTGWTTSDSIEYINDTTNITGFITYSDSLSLLMSSIDPPPMNYYWWVGKDSCSAANLETFTSEFKIYTDSQTGTFFLDYMLGDDFEGLNYQRSNDHLIIVGDTIGCFPEGITFTTQAEIDNFQTNYPNCDQIAGNFTIAGNEISNLNGLNNLTSIGGSFSIADSVPLISMGLDNLSSIGGTFSLKNNNTLINLSGMDNLTIVGGGLLIENTNLTNLMELESLNTIGENFSVITNSTLTSLTGLDSIYIGGSLEIINNALLASLSGLENLNYLGGDHLW